MEYMTQSPSECYDLSFEEQGRRDVDLLLGGSAAFEYRQILDRRGFRIGGPEVFEVAYVSSDTAMPDGFGWWPMSEGLAYSGLPSDRQWVEPPVLGEAVALKKRVMNDQIANERTALLIANRLFSPDAPNRPMRLHGFGTGEGEFFGHLKENGYIITELLPPDFISYKEYLESRSSIPLDEGLAMALSLAEVIAIMHQAGIAHGDLEGAGHEEHLYWNSQNRQLRIIDWSHAMFSTAFYESGIHLDQMAIIEVTEQILRLGGADEDSITFTRRMYDDVSQEYPEKYPETLEGTNRLVHDLRILKSVTLH